MTPPTRLLLLGAGRSASSLLRYLLAHAPAERWFITVADAQPAHLAPVLAAHSQFARAVPLDVQHEAQLTELVEEADIVISMLPASFHGAVARACLALGRHLATASYVSAELRALHEPAAAAGLVFLMECGLDPGLDHMSAMQAIERIKARGGRLTAFASYCGGLLDPASEGDNPWRYKFTWNPRNVVLAGQGGAASYLENGHLRLVPYQRLFAQPSQLRVPGVGELEGYPNRDSLSYRAPYGLADIPSIIRGTLRRPGYCGAWQALVGLGLTDDTTRLPAAGAPRTWAALVAGLLPAAPAESTDKQAKSEAATALAVRAAAYLRLDPHGPEMTRLVWLGLFENHPLGRAEATLAELLEHRLAEKWQLQPHDRDLIVLQHQFTYQLDEQARRLTSSLAVTGDDATHTAMAKTVGLPLGMAVRRLARGLVAARGVVIPTAAELYEPILAELAADYGIAFTEEEHEVSLTSQTT